MPNVMVALQNIGGGAGALQSAAAEIRREKKKKKKNKPQHENIYMVCPIT